MTPTRTAITLLALGLAFSCPVWADTSLDGITLTCSGDLEVGTGDRLSVRCSGDLLIPGGQTLQAVESIDIASTGRIDLRGNLVAPDIRLEAGGDLGLGGGLFSGSPDRFPEVSAQYTRGGALVVAGFRDLVPQPYIHPVYGAVVITQQYVPPLQDSTLIELVVLTPDALSPEQSAVDLEAAPLPVPEPAHGALFAVGLGLLALRLGQARARAKGQIA